MQYKNPADINQAETKKRTNIEFYTDHDSFWKALESKTSQLFLKLEHNTKSSIAPFYYHETCD